MSERYIKLSFTNAKLFPKNNRTKDVVANIATTSKGKLIFKHSKRSGQEVTSFKEPITVHQISNMLHTLVGERPIPSFRKVFYKADEAIFNIANQSFIKINTPKQPRKIMGEDVVTFFDETTRLGKSIHNSNLKPNTIQWFKVEKYLGEFFDEFIILINDVVGYDVLSEPFENLDNIYQKYGDKLDDLILKIKSNYKTPIANFLISKDQPRSEITVGIGEKVVSGIDVVHFLDGEILIPYEQGFVDRLFKNTTNILDGGFVEIIGVFYEDELHDIDGFEPVSEISDEKY